MGMDFIQKLPTPAEIREQYPVPPALAALKKQRDRRCTDRTERQAACYHRSLQCGQ